MIPIRRTFEALKFPKGSEERAKLNLHTLTSEYMPSYRYNLGNDDGTVTGPIHSFRTKAEAELHLRYQ